MCAICVLAILIVGASAETSGCAANTPSCQEGIPVGDAMSLLQQRNMKMVERDDPRLSCPAGQVLAYGDDCGVGTTTTPAPLCVDGKTASGKECEGQIKIKILTHRRPRSCRTASGEECRGEFKYKIRETSELKDGEYVLFKRELSRDGGRSWKELPLRMSLSELGSFTLSDEDVGALIPRDHCCVPDDTSGTQAVLSGTVKDAKTNDAIEGATVQIPSQGLKTTTGPDGDFHFDKVKVGQEVLTAKANNYADYKNDALTIEEGMSDLSIKMIKPTKPGEWTIVMTWENQPTDLEAVTTFGKCETKPYPTDKQSCDDHSGMRGELDIDNANIATNADKPETTTLTKVNAFTGTIFFRVDNWQRISNSHMYYCKEDDERYDASKCGPIADSKARVEVHGPDTEKIFSVGKKDGDLSDDGKYWYVFSMDAKTGIVSPCKRGGGCK